MWSGADGAIPTGWALCNGSNGTPDLRGRFIISSTYSAGIGGLYGGGQTTNVSTTQTGGLHDHLLSTGEMPSHNHPADSQHSDVNHDHALSYSNGQTSIDHTHTTSPSCGQVADQHVHPITLAVGDGNAQHGHTGGNTGNANAAHAHPVSIGGAGSHSHPISINFGWSESPGGWEVIEIFV